MIRFFVVAVLLVSFAIPAYTADTQWAVVIGISDYKNLPQDQWLKFAHEDARSFADHLKSRFVGVPPENVKFLINQEATSENIKDALGSWLPDHAGAGDTVYIYFAGHGVVDKTDQAYFVTYDTNPDRLYATAYPMLEMKRLMATLPHRHLILVSDACKSGSIGKEARTSRDLEVVKFNDVFKGVVGENAGVMNSDFLLTAAGSNEKSYESAEWGGGHGTFTFNLVEGLKGAADRDANGVVDANEIYDYVRENVRKATGDKQHPVAATSNFDGNLVLSMLKTSATPASRTAAPVPRTTGATTGVTAAPAVGTGTLLVTTNVANTRVLIDNDLRGTVDTGAPKSFSVSPGQHIFEATRDGYTRQQKIIDVQPGRQVVEVITLAPDAPSLVPDLRTRLIKAQKQLGTRQDADGMKNIQAVFTDLLLPIKGGRRLLADEEEFATEVFLLLSDQLVKKKQAAALTTLSDGYFQVFPIIPEDLVTKAPPDAMASLLQAGTTLTVEVEPLHSAVDLDSFSLGALDGPKTLLVRSGQHKLRVQRSGYSDLEQALDLSPGQTVTVQSRLRLAKIQVALLSQTLDVTITSNGQPSGPFRPLSEVHGSLSSEEFERLNTEIQRRGLDDQIQVALLRDIAPDTADLQLRFSRDKYSSQDARLDLASRADQIYSQVGDYVWDGIVKLEPLTGTLDITSEPSGADVFVSGKNIGKTPLSQWRTEIGDYDVTVSSGVWKSVHRVAIKDKETTKIESKLRAPIVFLGVHSPAVDPAKLRDIENRIVSMVPVVLKNYLGEYQNFARYEYARDFLLAAAGAVAAPATARANPMQRLAEMQDRFGTELFLFGYFPTELDFLSNKLRFYLFSSFTTRPDIREVQLDKPEAMEAFFKDLDSVQISKAALFKPYIGLTALDTELAGHQVIVLKVDEGGPAAKAGIQKDDVIVSINGEQPEAWKLSAWVSQNPVGSELRLDVETAAGRKTVNFPSDPLPRFVSDSGTKTFVNAILGQLDWLKRNGGAQPSYESNIVVLNQALAYISKEDWSNALTVLNNFANDAPSASVLRPAVYYYKGFCFERLNDRASARQWYDTAAKEKDTLLQSELAFDFQTLGSWRVDYLK